MLPAGSVGEGSTEVAALATAGELLLLDIAVAFLSAMSLSIHPLCSDIAYHPL